MYCTDFLLGSIQDLPQNLLQQIKDFEDMFTVDRTKLKQIVNHFVKELEKGRLRSLVHRSRCIALTAA